MSLLRAIAATLAAVNVLHQPQFCNPCNSPKTCNHRLGVNVNAIVLTTAGLVFSGDVPIVWEFLMANPVCIKYNIITAITSASGQLCIFYTIKEVRRAVG